jgi:hypothetical protein
MQQLRELRDVYLVRDAKGKPVSILHNPHSILGLPGWTCLKGRFVPTKRQMQRNEQRFTKKLAGTPKKT